ncbi:MAG: hypothetical protein DCC54_09065 [Anaerolineae bacterium]|nr:MAG: hypothetical protein DCC54_09065 [Anaerolineae bacterium]
MRAIRRLYFYAVSFITLEIVLWGLIRLLRSIFSTSQIGAGGDALAQALALIFVGAPIFALHWIGAQRRRSPRSSRSRRTRWRWQTAPSSPRRDWIPTAPSSAPARPGRTTSSPSG